jgi:site-specific recombinase XerD
MPSDRFPAARHTPRHTTSLEQRSGENFSAAKRPPHTPKYRRHATGQAYVVLNGRTHYLGHHDSDESRERYDRLLAEWLARGRTPAIAAEATVAELIAAYWQFAQTFYQRDGRPTAEIERIRRALRPVRQLYGSTAAQRFGPLAFKTVRQTWIDRGCARTTVNMYAATVRRMFKWAAAEQIVPPSVHHGLAAVDGLRFGRCNVREGKKVRPVADEWVVATLPHVSRQVATMIQLQRCTGMRGGEVVQMRAADLDMRGALWEYRPARHKTQLHGVERVIMLGPKAQQLIKPFLTTDLQAPLFSPAAAEKERRTVRHLARRTPLSCGNKPGTNRRRKPARRPLAAYTTASYARAITRGCDLAFPPPAPLGREVLADGRQETLAAWRKRLTDAQKRELAAWRRSHRWHPHQLRHSYATEVRQRYGIEVARVMLGHSKVATSEIYAERDQSVAVRIAADVG